MLHACFLFSKISHAYRSCIECTVDIVDGNYESRQSWCPLDSLFPEKLGLKKQKLKYF